MSGKCGHSDRDNKRRNDNGCLTSDKESCRENEEDDQKCPAVLPTSEVRSSEPSKQFLPPAAVVSASSGHRTEEEEQNREDEHGAEWTRPRASEIEEQLSTRSGFQGGAATAPGAIAVTGPVSAAHNKVGYDQETKGKIRETSPLAPGGTVVTGTAAVTVNDKAGLDQDAKGQTEKAWDDEFPVGFNNEFDKDAADAAPQIQRTELPRADSRNTPGAYNVRGRAAGQLPLWARPSPRALRLGAPRMRMAPSAEAEEHGSNLVEADVETVSWQVGDINSDNSDNKSWTRNMKLWLALAMVVIVGVAVGLGVSLSSGGGDESMSQAAASDSGDDHNFVSLCSSNGVLANPGSPVGRSGRYIELKGILSPLVSHSQTFEQTCSPQDRALMFLADEDPLTVTLSEDYGIEMITQRYILALFYYSTTDTGDWTSANGWLTGSESCTWEYIDCNDGGHISGLVINKDNGLEGTLPEELRSLLYLITLKINENAIKGQIPTGLRNLTRLETLNFHDNELTGGIPLELGDLSSLWMLDLSYNDLDGPIPESFSTLSNLKHLSLERNELTESIPLGLYSLSDLTHFNIAFNNIQGTISPAVGFLSHLEYISLQDNELDGTIPSDLFCLPLLEELDLSKNAFAGNIPTLGNMSSLEYLDISNNDINGTLPPSLSTLTGLVMLRLNSNDISGRVFKEIGDLGLLTHLFLDDNDLTGSLPIEMANLTSLVHLVLSRNALSGTIPEEFGRLTNLEQLDFSVTNLNGTVPENICSIFHDNPCNLKDKGSPSICCLCCRYMHCGGKKCCMNNVHRFC